MNTAYTDMLKKADEARLFFEVQMAGSWLFKNRQHRTIAVIQGNQEYLSSYKQQEQKVDMVKKILAEKHGVTGLGDFDLWLDFWQKYTIGLGVERYNELVSRISNNQPADDLLPKMTFKEWHNARIKNGNAPAK